MPKSPLTLSAPSTIHQLDDTVNWRDIRWHDRWVGTVYGRSPQGSDADRPDSYDVDLNGVDSRSHFPTLTAARAALVEELSGHHLYGDPATFALLTAIRRSGMSKEGVAALFEHMVKPEIDPDASVVLRGGDGKFLIGLDGGWFFRMRYDAASDWCMVRRTALSVGSSGS